LILFLTDQELDKESGLYNYDARLYDPVVGRFISPDSIVPRRFDSQAYDRYAYTLNNPLKYTDPSGHFIFSATAFAIGVTYTSVMAALDAAVIGSVAWGIANTTKTLQNKHVNRTNHQITVKDKIPNSDLLGPPSKRGNAPIGKDGHPVELHHPDQQNTDERGELSRTDHRGKGNFKKNHPNVGQEPSKIDRTKSKKDHRDHWGKEMDRGRFDDFDDKNDSDQSDNSEKSGNDDKGEVDSEEE
jgi:RHS repeat-associated protein